MVAIVCRLLKYADLITIVLTVNETAFGRYFAHILPNNSIERWHSKILTSSGIFEQNFENDLHYQDFNLILTLIRKDSVTHIHGHCTKNEVFH